jgi:large subunit ribosomal protein L23
MALFDFFKKKKEVKKEEKKKEKPVKKEVEVKKEVKEKPVKAKPAGPKKERKITGESLKILKSPHVAEKATDLLEKNQYVFKIWPRANKAETKKAIESIFKVDVLGVKIINIPKKKRRLGKTEGFRKGHKKAIIRIKEGQKIEVLTR